MALEKTPIGLQYVLPGAERKSRDALAKRKAAEPLRATVAQKPMDVGLFSDDARQLDLVDKVQSCSPKR